MSKIQLNDQWRQDEQMARRKKIVIACSTILLFGVWVMMVFYALKANKMEQAYVPGAAYVPHTQIPAMGGPAFYSPKRSTLMYRSGCYHQPSAVSNTFAPKAAMSSTSSGATMRVHQTSSAAVHSYGGGGTGGGASTYNRRSRNANGSAINYTAIAYTGSIYVPTRHDAVTAVGAAEAENVAARKMGAPHRTKNGGEGEWPDMPEDPAPDPEPPVPAGEVPIALMLILSAVYALHSGKSGISDNPEYPEYPESQEKKHNTTKNMQNYLQMSNIFRNFAAL